VKEEIKARKIPYNIIYMHKRSGSESCKKKKRKKKEKKQPDIN
jgi:hypothetical protein